LVLVCHRSFRGVSEPLSDLFDHSIAIGALHLKFDMGAVKFTPSGLTDKDGKFVLSTASASDGAPPGEYEATLSLPRTESERWKAGR
jgi:hypothetical protein